MDTDNFTTICSNDRSVRTAERVYELRSTSETAANIAKIVNISLDEVIEIIGLLNISENYVAS